MSASVCQTLVYFPLTELPLRDYCALGEREIIWKSRGLGWRCIQGVRGVQRDWEEDDGGLQGGGEGPGVLTSG